MKLLITTQGVDLDDPILGFFHAWIEAFSARVDSIEVICLKEGRHTLPDNVRVHSLGKERGAASRVAYALRFLSLAWRLRHDYDTVFVHMNPEYVVLGGMFWRLWRKRVTFWYNHPYRGLRLWCAVRLAHRVFFTSPHAASARFPNAIRMPAGIDTTLFVPRMGARDRHSVYAQGRIAPSKRIDLLLAAVRLLRARGVPVTATLVGPEEAAYGDTLRKEFADLCSSGAVVFLGAKRNRETPSLFGAQGVFVNLAAAGHYDKSVLEAMACETPVVTSSPAFTGLIPEAWIVPVGTPEALADALEKLVALSEEEYRALGATLRTAVAGQESLALLTERLVQQWT